MGVLWILFFIQSAVTFPGSLFLIFHHAKLLFHQTAPSNTISFSSLVVQWDRSLCRHCYKQENRALSYLIHFAITNIDLQLQFGSVLLSLQHRTHRLDWQRHWKTQEERKVEGRHQFLSSWHFPTDQCQIMQKIIPILHLVTESLLQREEGHH